MNNGFGLVGSAMAQTAEAARRAVTPCPVPCRTDLEAAWAAVHETTPEGWYVGQPMEHPKWNEWSQLAFDPSETPTVGKRSREWIAVGRTELECVQVMARCLGELREGRWPE